MTLINCYFVLIVELSNYIIQVKIKKKGDFMKKLFITFIASAFALTINTTLIAAGTYSVGAIYNNLSFEAEGSNTIFVGDQHDRTSVSSDQNVGSLFIEYNATAESGLGVSLGFEVIPGSVEFATKSRADTNATDDDDGDAGTYTGTAEISNPKTIYVEPTFMFNDSLGMYLKGGISHVTFTDHANNGARTSSYEQKSVFGGMYGIGAKYKHSSGFFVKAEGAMTKWSTFTSSNSRQGESGLSRIKVNPEQKAVRLAVGLAF